MTHPFSKRTSETSDNCVSVRGAREHNLKNISLTFPQQAMVVVTGPSGSGKSSLAIDTIYAEGQRRYLEMLSYQSNELLARLAKPKVEWIEGLPPTVVLRPFHGMRHPLATVGTVTRLEDYLRVLGARLGTAYCPQCDTPVAPMSLQTIATHVLAHPANMRFTVLAPLGIYEGNSLKPILEDLRRRGFVRVLFHGKTYALDDASVILPEVQGELEVQIDRLRVDDSQKSRLFEALELALTLSPRIHIRYENETTEALSPHWICMQCHAELPPLSVELLSFTHRLGSCADCHGLGRSDNNHASSSQTCMTCLGTRLSRAASAVRLGGLRFTEVRTMSADALCEWLATLPIDAQHEELHTSIREPLRRRLKLLGEVGLGYLELSRSMSALSVGEASRVALIGQWDSAMSGVLCIIDEPSQGLHRADLHKMLNVLKKLRAQGNSTLIVEHDLAVIRQADHLIDMGPGAGSYGGHIISQGTPKAVSADRQSITGQYLAGSRSIPVPNRRRAVGTAHIAIKRASIHTLNDLSVDIPLGLFVGISGVSGSGKTVLVRDVLVPALTHYLQGEPTARPSFATFEGFEHIHKLISVDQEPIGRNARSNPATYTGLWDVIRELYASLPEARARGYKTSRFSFNVKGGRCEACQGTGIVHIDMSLLPDAHVPCEQCSGLRFNAETLHVRYKGLHVAELLNRTISEARDLLGAIPKAERILQALERLGLGYLQLGQAAPTLSGGEAQRLKLASELARPTQNATLYVLDEPSAGLHLSDVEILLKALHGLVDQGHTVIAIEHHLDILKQADHLIDLGPGAGPFGGHVIATGTPEALTTQSQSLTGKELKQVLPA